MTELDAVWVRQVCTLPTVDRPVRLDEFDELFATSLRGVVRVSPTVVQWSLDPAAEEAVRDLTARESQCCSFFRFGFVATGDMLLVDVEVPAAQIIVLDALTARAADAMGKR